jgi:peroxiredoxin Q/BCP
MKKLLILLVQGALAVLPGGALALEAGDPAPPFEVDSTAGSIRLEDYLGKQNIVLAFYYADFTPV